MFKKTKNSYTVVAHHKQKRCKIKSHEFLFQQQELISLWHVCLQIKLSKLLAKVLLEVLMQRKLY